MDITGGSYYGDIKGGRPTQLYLTRVWRPSARPRGAWNGQPSWTPLGGWVPLCFGHFGHVFFFGEWWWNHVKSMVKWWWNLSRWAVASEHDQMIFLFDLKGWVENHQFFVTAIFKFWRFTVPLCFFVTAGFWTKFASGFSRLNETIVTVTVASSMTLAQSFKGRLEYQAESDVFFQKRFELST